MKTETHRPWYILPVIVIAQFAGTSLWFAGNAIIDGLIQQYDVAETAVGVLTSSVQLGFITGTLVFAILTLSDRFSPRWLFLISAILGAFFNALIVVAPFGFTSVIIYRFLTGFFLAGIYPVGMKIASDWFQKGLGNALGFLVGALVLGTALPHSINALFGDLGVSPVIYSVSAFAVFGGLLLFLFVPNGPFRKKAQEFNPSTFIRIFKVRDFRAAAFGYFGHMWELYAFWAFVPFLISLYNSERGASLNISLWAFIIIGLGALGCIMGGVISLKKGSARVAFVQLAISGILCLISPFLLSLPLWLFIFLLCIWGITVVGDSPQFSTLSARTAPPENIGTALTIVTCIGFTITIFSIQLVSFLAESGFANLLMIFLLPGPVLGLLALNRLVQKKM